MKNIFLKIFLTIFFLSGNIFAENYLSKKNLQKFFKERIDRAQKFFHHDQKHAKNKNIRKKIDPPFCKNVRLNYRGVDDVYWNFREEKMKRCGETGHYNPSQECIEFLVFIGSMQDCFRDKTTRYLHQVNFNSEEDDN